MLGSPVFWLAFKGVAATSMVFLSEAPADLPSNGMGYLHLAGKTSTILTKSRELVFAGGARLLGKIL